MIIEEKIYREWLGSRIEGYTGTLNGEGKALWSLDTTSLEKVYTALSGKNALDSYMTATHSFIERR